MGAGIRRYPKQGPSFPVASSLMREDGSGVQAVKNNKYYERRSKRKTPTMLMIQFWR